MQRLICTMACLLLYSCAAKKQEPDKLTIFGLGLEAGEQLRRDALAEFTESTGVEVDVVPTPGTSSEQLRVIRKLLGKHSASPDLYVIDMVWPGTIQEGLLDLTPYLNDEARRHVPALVENDTVANRVIALPFYVNVGMLYSRQDLLKKYGYHHPPRTWDELDEMALRIQQGERATGKKPFWGFVWQGAPYEGLTCNALEWQASSGGGSIVESDRTVSVNNPRAERALDEAARRVNLISPAGVLSYTESDSLNVFRSGGAAFLRHWSSAYRQMDSAMPAGNLTVSLLPRGRAARAQAVGGFHIAVSRFSGHPENAVKLALYLTSTVVQRRRALRRGYVPTRHDMYKDAEVLEALPQLRILGDASSADWVARPSTATGEQYSDVSRAYYQTVHRVLSGKVKAKPALASLEQELTHLLKIRRDQK